MRIRLVASFCVLCACGSPLGQSALTEEHKKASAKAEDRLLLYNPAPLFSPNGVANTSSIPIKVCWQTAGWDVEKELVINALKRTWGRVAPFEFSAGCSGQKADVFIYDSDCCGQSSGHGIGTSTIFNFRSVESPFNFSRDSVRYQAVHEFGHVLGYAHEQDSPSRPNEDCSRNECVPRTCAQQGATCGLAGDGCGGVIDCDACASPLVCGAGAHPSQCWTGAPCVPKTCAQMNAACGVAADGCGGLTPYCGTCASGLGCGVTGVPNQCGPLVQAAWGNVTQIGAWDVDSIMHYCNDYNNSFGHLSVRDIDGVRQTYGTRQVRNRGDFVGSAGAEIGIWRPSTGEWYVPGLVAKVWGQAGDVAVPGDYDGNGKDDRAVWRPSTGIWYVDDWVTGPVSWGAPNDVPVPGDYNGDGKTDFAVWRPSTGVWYVLMNPFLNPTTIVKTWGESSDTPVPGDYDGDGITEIAVWRPAPNGASTWYVDAWNGAYNVTNLGSSGDIPVPGDYAGEGKVRPAIYTPVTGVWEFLVRPAISNGLASPLNGRWRMLWGGTTGDIPVPASYSGRGITEIGIWRPTMSPARFYIVGYQVDWGQTGDVPMPKYAN